MTENSATVLDWFIVQLRLQLLVVGNLPHTFQEVFLDDVVSLGTDSKHSYRHTSIDILLTFCMFTLVSQWSSIVSWNSLETTRARFIDDLNSILHLRKTYEQLLNYLRKLKFANNLKKP